jgi:glycosyltransferase involved in cell wall biosynthesis
MKPILFVAYHYPPASAVGGIRPSKLVRYLQQYGWSSVVLTATGAACGVPPSCVVRVREWPHPLKVYQRLREQRLKRLGRIEELRAKTSFAYAMAAEGGRPNRVTGWLVPLLTLPDREMGWLVPAIWRGWRLVRAHRIKCLVTTGPPFTCHLVGLALKAVTGLPWVAEFRDPWSLDHKYRVLRNGPSDRLESWLIRQVMTRADRVVSVTSRMTDDAIKEHPELSQTKFVTLTSGFDPADYDDVSWQRPVGPPVVFAYFGTFYHGRTPEPFLRALKSLIDDGTLRKTDIRVRFVGLVEHAEGQSLDAMLRDLDLESVVTVEGPVSRREALRQTLETHVVLVLNEQHPTQIPFKLYEALGAGAIVLNVGSAGAVGDVLTATGRGVAVDYRSMAEVRRGIMECIGRSRDASRTQTDQPWRDPAIAPFNFERLAGRLAAVLDTLEQPEPS